MTLLLTAALDCFALEAFELARFSSAKLSDCLLLFVSCLKVEMRRKRKENCIFMIRKDSRSRTEIIININRQECLKRLFIKATHTFLALLLVDFLLGLWRDAARLDVVILNVLTALPVAVDVV